MFLSYFCIPISRTVLLWITFFTSAASESVRPPTLLDIRDRLNCTTEEATYQFSVQVIVTSHLTWCLNIENYNCPRLLVVWLGVWCRAFWQTGEYTALAAHSTVTVPYIQTDLFPDLPFPLHQLPGPRPPLPHLPLPPVSAGHVSQLLHLRSV